jgi:hypothetical protein
LLRPTGVSVPRSWRMFVPLASARPRSPPLGMRAKCVSFLDSLSEADFAKTTAQTLVPLAYPAGKALRAEEYLFGRQIPNFYFHVVTAYDILRQGGVQLSKADYLGELPLIDA